MMRQMAGVPGSLVVSTAAATHTFELSLVEITRSLEAAEWRLAALVPYTRLAESHLQELRETRLLVEAVRATGRGIAPGPGAEAG